MIPPIITTAAIGMLEQAIEERSYKVFKKLFFPKKTYKKRLFLIVNNTIKEFEKIHILTPTENKFPFYESDIFFKELNKYILFNSQVPNYNSIIDMKRQNPNILVPSTDELNLFYSIFFNNIQTDKKLKDLFVEENYKNRIFSLKNHLIQLKEKLTIYLHLF
jgi:hypothetical protein